MTAPALAQPSPDLASGIARCELLARLTPEELSQFALYLDVVTIAAGQDVVHEGEAGQAMFFVLDGTAHLTRRHVELRALGAGDIFGELALITNRLRAATVTATSTLVLARLTCGAYERLLTENPALASRFLQTLVSLLGSELVSMTESVRLLLTERSLPRRTVVKARWDHTASEVPTGTVVGTILPGEQDGAKVVAALIDRKAVSLGTPLFADALLEPLTVVHAEGREVVQRSAGLAVLEAAAMLDPSLVVRLGATHGAIQEIEVTGTHDLPALASRLDAALQQLIESNRRFVQEQWGIEEASAHFIEQGWPEAARQLRIWRGATAPLSSCGKIYALSPGPLLPSTHALAGVHVTTDGEGLILDFGDELRKHLPAPRGVQASGLDRRAPIPPEGGDMVGDHHRWLEGLGATSVGAFNDLCVSGQVAQLIRVAEGFHEKRLGRLADLIAAQQPELRVICIAGPSSSGKTTFIKRLSVQLQVNGVQPVSISLDDYYVDREKNVRDEHGDYDFEAFEAIDSALLRQQVVRLLQGETIRTARYDFKTGLSQPEGGPELSLPPGSVLLLEGIHGLNPRLLAEVVPENAAFRIFIHPATTLRFDRLSRVSTADLRLLRRIVRDRHTRGYQAAENIQRWASVARGERLHIFPYLPHASAIFDSSLVYEIPVLKVFADRYLLEVPPGHPAATTAHRLRHLLDRFVTIYPDHVPPTSLLREFIGGSGFEY